jgi:hypothetical protein
MKTLTIEVDMLAFVTERLLVKDIHELTLQTASRYQ